MNMRATAECRSCGSPIRWAIADASGKRMPLDPDAHTNGNIWVLRWEGGSPVVAVAASPDDVPSSEAMRYRSHFVTCPDGPSWRRN